MSHQSFRAQSRIDWGKDSNQGALTQEQINSGALLRIADATEKMAHRHTELIRDRDYYKERADHWQSLYESMAHRCRSLKGQITKLNKKLAQLEKKP